MKTTLCLGLTVALLFLLMVSSGEILRSRAIQPTPEPNPALNVRQAVVLRDSIDGKVVVLRGKVTGYHELVLFEGDPNRPGYFLQLALSSELERELMRMTLKAWPESTDAKGTILVKGRFLKDGGKLYTYPPRIVEDFDKCSNLSALAVDRLDGDLILEYTP